MTDQSVSVIIPTHNRAGLVGRAVRSALEALEAGDEVIVIDDASTDGTGEALAPLAGAIRYRRIEARNAGAARNAGLEMAIGTFVTFLDSDDEWLSDKIALQRALMQVRPDVLFCFSNFACGRPGRGITHDGLGGWFRHSMMRGRGKAPSWRELMGPPVAYSTLARLPGGRGDFDVYVGDVYRPMMDIGLVCTITLMVRRQESAGVLGFPQDLPTFEDYECFSRLCAAGPGAYMDCETAINWGHDGSRLTDADELTCIETRMAILQRVWGGDEHFLCAHGDEYSRLLGRLHLQKARLLFRQGLRDRGRAELALAGRAGLSHRVMGMAPGALTRKAFEIRDNVAGRGRSGRK